MKQFLVLLLIAAMTASSGCSLKWSTYLENHYTALDIENLDLSFLDADRYRVFLSGAEHHGTKASYDLHYALFTALHQQFGVRYMLVSMGHATAAMYNTYVQTGDSQLLDHLHSQLQFTTASNYEHRRFWEKLHQYNQALPEDEKITIVGIDLEYRPLNAINMLVSSPGAKTLPGVVPPRGFRPSLNGLNDYVHNLQGQLAANRELFRHTLDENYEEFLLVLNNLADTVAANIDREEHYTVRSRVMYNNFLRVYNDHPGSKFFGHFTMEHIYQNTAETPRIGGGERLGVLLNKHDSPVRGQVLSIAAAYVDSICRFGYGRFFNLEIEEEYLRHLRPFINLAETDYSLFRLDGVNSPFVNRRYLVKRGSGGVTTDYFQYLLLIRNSPPTTPNRS